MAGQGKMGWEYNAPQYVDFSSPQLDDADADKWFDFDHEGRIGMKVADTFEDDIEPTTPKRIIHPKQQQLDAESVEKEATQEAQPTRSKPALCTSLEEWKKKTQGQKRLNSNQDEQNKTQDTRRRSPRTQNIKAKPATIKRHNSCSEVDSSGAIPRMKKRRESPNISSDRMTPERNVANTLSRNKASTSLSQLSSSATMGTSNNRHPTLKRSNSMTKGRPTSQERIGHKRGLSADRNIPLSRRPGSGSSDTLNRMPQLTIPMEPAFMKRKAMKTTDTKKTEDLEMEKIAQLREELAKKRKQAQESYKKAITAYNYKPALSAREATVPKEFHFTTDTRIKPSTADNPEHNSRERPPSPARGKTNLHPTIPQPFNLTETRKRKVEVDENSGEEFKSVAERVKAFHKSTPDRFHTLPRGTNGTQPVRGWPKSPRKLTQPKTPQLQTRSRSRPANILTKQELEEKEVEEIEKNQFRAHPVNYKIIHNPNTGVRKVESKPLTKVEEFSLTATKQMHTRGMLNDHTEEHFKFHAQPVPTKILEGVVGVKAPKEIPVTVPESPAFALKHRARIPLQLPDEKEAHNHSVKANPVPHTGIPFQPKLPHKITQPEPFTFEERDKALQARKEEKIQEILTEEMKAREFHANPMPTTADNLLSKSSKPLTKPQPFNLESEHRGQKKADEWHSRIEEELRQQRSVSKFKATSSAVVHQDPFVPHKSTKPLTDISEFDLNTERRAMKRENFEMSKKAKEAEIEAIRRQREIEQLEEEKAVVAKLRTEMVHKSHPIRKYKAVDTIVPEKPLTAPISPQLLTNTRLRSKVRV